jgi:hypothetical protein
LGCYTTPPEGTTSCGGTTPTRERRPPSAVEEGRGAARTMGGGWVGALIDGGRGAYLPPKAPDCPEERCRGPGPKRVCDSPGVYFVLCREIYPKLGSSVGISISRSSLSPFIKLIVNTSPNSELFDLERPNLEPVKTFISRHECKLDNQSRFINLV